MSNFRLIHTPQPAGGGGALFSPIKCDKNGVFTGFINAVSYCFLCDFLRAKPLVFCKLLS